MKQGEGSNKILRDLGSLLGPLLALGMTVLVALIALGLAQVFRSPADAIGLLSTMGGVILALAAGGMVSVVVAQFEQWEMHAICWSMIALVGVVMLAPGWDTALALAVAVLGLTLRRGGALYKS